MLGLPEDASIEQINGLADKLFTLYDKKPERLQIFGGTTVLPKTGSGDGSDSVDRAIASLEKHIALQEADAKAGGLGAAALARFRAEAALTAAVQANGGEVTAKQAAQFEILKDRAASAAEALARARVANDIKFGRNTGLLSQEDVQIATQLKQIYPEVSAALNSTEAAQIRFNNALRSTSGAIENSLTTGLADAISGTKSWGQAMADTGKQVLRAIEEVVIKLLIVGPLMRSLQGGFGGLFSLPALPKFAGGTDFAPGGPSIINENGGEIVNLPTGAKVIPHDVSMRMAAGGGGAVSVGDTNIVIHGNVGENELQSIKVELAAHRRLMAQQIKDGRSAQRMQRTGVG